MSKVKYKQLPSQQYLKECFDYNTESGKLVWKERPLSHFKNTHGTSHFNSRYKGCVAGTLYDTGYVEVSINKKRFKLHRLIWKYHMGDDPIGLIDHIDRDKSNNRIENLRDVSHIENSNNKSNSNDCIGVYFILNRWEGRLTIKGNLVLLGRFKNKNDAIDAVNSARVKDWSHLETKVKVKGTLTLEYLNDNYVYENGHLVRNNRRVGSISATGYSIVTILNVSYQVHRVIYWLCTGIKPENGDVIDHINGDKLDNRIENLRLVTVSQNGMNRKVSRSNTSGYVGVTFCKDSQKWNASLYEDNNHVYLGTFQTKEEAVSARKAAEELYHGEFARVTTTQGEIK